MDLLTEELAELILGCAGGLPEEAGAEIELCHQLSGEKKEATAQTQLETGQRARRNLTAKDKEIAELHHCMRRECSVVTETIVRFRHSPI